MIAGKATLRNVSLKVAKKAENTATKTINSGIAMSLLDTVVRIVNKNPFLGQNTSMKKNGSFAKILKTKTPKAHKKTRLSHVSFQVP